MRKALYLFLLVTSISSVSLLIGCDKEDDPQPESQPTLADKIIGKWIMHWAVGSSIDFNNEKTVFTSPFTANDYFDFKADGTVTIFETNQTYKGNWKIVNDKVVFTNTNYIDYATGGWEVKFVNANDLQLYHKDVQAHSSLETWLDFYR